VSRSKAKRAAEPPLLLAVVHTEEEFDWSAPFDRRCTRVNHLKEIGRVQEIFTRLGVHATYAVTFPVADDDRGSARLQSALDGCRATIGTHLHPWVNPPFAELLSAANSYPGNLPQELEREKLHRLDERIAASFGQRSCVYLAGRHGFGPHTLPLLQELGYRLDLSGLALTDLSADGGPDYSALGNDPSWEGVPGLLRIPHSVAYAGRICHRGWPGWAVRSAQLAGGGLAGAMTALRLVRRLRLSPEGSDLAQLKVCASALQAIDCRVFVFSFHSPSVVPGFTPYVRDRDDLQDFLRRIEGFLRFFRDEMGGRFTSPEHLLARWQPVPAADPGCARACRMGVTGQPG
jgi:hypothetical protein